MNTEQRGPRLIDVPGVQKELGGISRTTVYELVNRGELTKVSIGRRSFITAESVAALVERLSEAATACVSRD